MIDVFGDANLALMPLDRHELTACIAEMLERAGAAGASVELECMHDARMGALNAEHMGGVGPTNILSFPSGDGGFLGSLALSVDCLRREAMVYGQEPAGYCKQLLAHGLAHLMGYDHGPDMDALCAVMLGDGG
jgi:metalloprotein, YbeY/UPF0054 family